MALARDQVLSIATEVGLGAKELSKQCEESLFLLLADFLHPWRLVFSSLLSDVDIDDVDRENQSEPEKRVAALRKWKVRNGHGATYYILVEAVLNSSRLDQAELICKHLAVHFELPSSGQGGHS